MAPASTDSSDMVGHTNGRVVGRVLWNAGGVAGIEVRLCDPDRLLACREQLFVARTGTDGSFTLWDVPPGQYSVALQAPPSEDYFYLTSGAFAEPARYAVAGGQTVDLGDQNIYRLDLDIVTPSSGSAVAGATPVLEWTAYPGAEYYEVSLAPVFGDPVLINSRTYSLGLTLDTPLLNCGYTWWVEAFDEQHGKLAENKRPAQFVVEDQPVSCYISGMSPAADARVSGETLALAWAPHPLAESYRVTLWRENKVGDGAGSDAAVGDAELVVYQAVTTVPVYLVPGPLAAGGYAWTVSAYRSPELQIAGSEPACFTVGR